jgi:hypothetical protein
MGKKKDACKFYTNPLTWTDHLGDLVADGKMD